MGKSRSFSTTTSHFAGTMVDSTLPSAVRAKAEIVLEAEPTVGGVAMERRMTFTRYTIAAADLPKWTVAFAPIGVDQVPPRPIKAAWWSDGEALEGASYFDAGNLARGGRGFVAIARDGVTA